MQNKKQNNARLSDIIKKMLGSQASAKLIREICPDILNELQPGSTIPTIAELLVEKIVKLALDPHKANQFAIELIFDRVEGKAAQGAPVNDDARIINERLDSITTDHLNAIATQFSKETTAALQARCESETENRTDRPTEKLLALSKNRINRTENNEGKPAVETGATT